MKKLISLLIVFCHLGVLAVPLIFADTTPPAPSTPEVWKMYAFPGIRTDYKDANGLPAKTQVRPLVNQLGDVKNQISSDGASKRLLVAHSQGGVRALAYARLTENQGKVAAVITVDSPVRGHSGLDGSYATNKRKLVENTWPLLDGIYSLEVPLNTFFWSTIASAMVTGGITMLTHGWLVDLLSKGKNAISDLKNRVGGNKDQYSAYIDQLPTKEDEVKNSVASFTGLTPVPGTLPDLWSSAQGIRDLPPGSTFLRTYVDPAQAKSQAYGYFVRFQTGVTRAASVNWVHHSYWWWSWDSPEGVNYSESPVYSYAYVRYQYTDAVTSSTTAPAYPTQATLAKDIKVGFIQGTNNDVDQLVRDAGGGGLAPAQYLSLAGTAFDVAQNISTVFGLLLFLTAIAWCVILGPWGVLAFIGQVIVAICWLNAASSQRSARDVARSLIPNLLGSSSHDGLIPTGDQWRPLDGATGIGGTALTGKSYQPYASYNDTHVSCTTDPRIWGQGGSFQMNGQGLTVTSKINGALPDSEENTPLVRKWVRSTFTSPASPPSGFGESASWTGGPSFAY